MMMGERTWHFDRQTRLRSLSVGEEIVNGLGKIASCTVRVHARDSEDTRRKVKEEIRIFGAPLASRLL